ncbi:MAG: hypothetical protein HZA95_01175 [Candidatus Vogelbacteria bacterium]|nr:hypothetical protein [Candidatus Vogelbacteria bacterium]
MNIHEFVHSRKHLFWSTKNYNGLNNEAIVETILNYGDWEDVLTLIHILGIAEVARIFRAETNRPRVNYNKRIVHYFSLFFQKYA